MTLKELSIIAGVGFDQGEKDINGKYMFSLSNVEIMEGGMLVSSCGRAKTRAKAKETYAKILCGVKIAVRAMQGSSRMELQLPPKVTAK